MYKDDEGYIICPCCDWNGRFMKYRIKNSERDLYMCDECNAIADILDDLDENIFIGNVSEYFFGDSKVTKRYDKWNRTGYIKSFEMEQLGYRIKEVYPELKVKYFFKTVHKDGSEVIDSFLMR